MDDINPTATAGYFIAAPCLDTHDYGDAERNSISFEDFKTEMLRFAEEWGEKAIGRQIRMHRSNIACVADEHGAYEMLAIGRFGQRRFAVISKGPYEVEFFEHEWNNNWNVTQYG